VRPSPHISVPTFPFEVCKDTLLHGNLAKAMKKAEPGRVPSGLRHDRLEIWRLDREIGCLDAAIQARPFYGDFRHLSAAVKFGNALRKLHPADGVPLAKYRFTGYRVIRVGK
jgi:hypothetical protein